MMSEGKPARRDGKEPAQRLARATLAAALLDRVLDRATRRQGFADARLVTDWARIVGADLAAETVPLKLDRRARVLTLKVRPTAALIVQHDEPRILERINGFFGTVVAHRLRLVQGVVGRSPAPVAPEPLALADREAIETAVATVEPAALREALADLGMAVRQRRKALDEADRTAAS